MLKKGKQLPNGMMQSLKMCFPEGSAQGAHCVSLYSQSEFWSDYAVAFSNLHTQETLLFEKSMN